MYTKIIHFSDVHIRLNTGFDVLRHVLEKFKEALRKYTPAETLLVCTGDVFHSKTSLSPDAILFARSFFEHLMLLDYTIVVIPGNHDGNEHNPNRRDAIQTLVPYFQIKKPLRSRFKYFRKTGIYRLDNISFGVGSCFSEQKKPPKASTIEGRDGNFHKVALFHGLVRGAMYQNQTTDTTSECRLEDFDGYDLTLLGDIHKHQFLSDTCAYASSLSQQNHGETIDGHGYIEWDLQSKTGKFIQIESDYGYVTLKVTEGIVEESSRIPKNVFFRMYHNRTSVEQLKAIQRRYCAKYNAIEWKLIRELDVTRQQNQINQFGQDMMDTAYVNKLIEGNYGANMDPIVLQKVIKMNVEMMKKADKESIAISGREWRLLNITFSNLFCFEKENNIDFENISGNQIVEIFGPNGSGKSSLVDIIAFGLFGKCSRGGSGKVIARKGARNFRVAVKISVNGKIYRIERLGTKMDTKKPKTETFVYQILGPNSSRPVTMSTQRQTNQMITGMVGTLETFELTGAMLTSSKTRSFLKETSTSRKAILSNLLGMHRFKDLLDLAKRERKMVDAKLRNLQIALPPEAEKEVMDKLETQVAMYEVELKNIGSELSEARKNEASVRKDLDQCKYQENVDPDDIKATHEELLEQDKNLALEYAETEAEIQRLEVQTKHLPTLPEYQAQKTHVSEQQSQIEEEVKSLKETAERCLREINVPREWSLSSTKAILSTLKAKVLPLSLDIDSGTNKFKDMLDAKDAERMHTAFEDLKKSRIKSLIQTSRNLGSKLVPTKDVEQSRKQLPISKSRVEALSSEVACKTACRAAFSGVESALSKILSIPFLSFEARDKMDSMVRSLRNQKENCDKQRTFFQMELKNFDYDKNCTFCVRNSECKIKQQVKLQVLDATSESLRTNLLEKEDCLKRLSKCVGYYEKHHGHALSKKTWYERESLKSEASLEAELQIVSRHQEVLIKAQESEELEHKLTRVQQELDQEMASVDHTYVQWTQLNKEREEWNTLKVKLQELKAQIHDHELQIKQDAENKVLQATLRQTRQRLDILGSTPIKGLDVIEMYESGKDTKSRLIRLKVQFSRLHSQIKRCRKHLSKVEVQLKDLEETRELREKVECLNTQLSHLTRDVRSYANLERQYDLKLVETKTKLQCLIEQQKRHAESNKKIIELQNKIAIIRQYETVLDPKKGIPNLVIGTVLPIIEQQVNGFLAEIVDFQLSFHLQPVKQHIEVDMIHRGVTYALGTCSSSEQVICDVVTRTVLGRLINKTHVGNVFIGDEIFAQFDVERKNTIPKLFDFLRRHFDASLIITHNDDIRQHVEHRIQIVQTGTWSKVKSV